MDVGIKRGKWPKRLRRFCWLLLGLLPAALALWLVLLTRPPAPEASIPVVEPVVRVFQVEEVANLAPQDTFGLKQLEKELGARFEFAAGSIDKFHTLLAAEHLPDMVQSPVANSQIRMFLQSGDVLEPSELLGEAFPGFEAPRLASQWFGDWKGRVGGYVHRFAQPGPSGNPGELAPRVMMMARADLMEQYGIAPGQFSTKRGALDALKIVRKNSPATAPCYFDFETLLWMFGGQFEDEAGEWQDMFLTPPALEALLFLNELYRERLLPLESLTISSPQLERKAAEGRVFAVSGPLCGKADSAKGFSPLPPIQPDQPIAGLRFPSRQTKGDTITLFYAKSQHAALFVPILLYFSLQDYPEIAQQPALAGYGRLEALAGLAGEWMNRENAAGPPTAVETAYSRQTGYLYPFERLFLYKSNTQLDSVSSALNEYRRRQIKSMVVASSAEEVRRLYELTVQGLGNLNEQLEFQWKSAQYLRAKELCRVDSFRIPPAQDAFPETKEEFQ